MWESNVTGWMVWWDWSETLSLRMKNFLKYWLSWWISSPCYAIWHSQYRFVVLEIFSQILKQCSIWCGWWSTVGTDILSSQEENYQNTKKFSVTLLYANDRSVSSGMDWVVTRTNIEQCKRLKMLFFTPKDGTTLNCKFNKLLLSLAEEWDIVGVNKKYVNNQANMTSWNIYENECCEWGWWCDTQGRRGQFLSFYKFHFNIICCARNIFILTRRLIIKTSTSPFWLNMCRVEPDVGLQKAPKIYIVN